MWLRQAQTQAIGTLTQTLSGDLHDRRRGG
jgi:hypothetical protein